MTITHDEVGRRIREARSKLGLSQTDLGQRLSRPRSHVAVSDIERGKTKLDIEELAEIARLLDQPLSYFTEANSAQPLVYRRSENQVSPEQRKANNRAVEAFMERARELAREQSKDAT